MGFYSELQIEVDDYEARYGKKADRKAVEQCTKIVHAERKIAELTWRLKRLENGSERTKERILHHYTDIKAMLSTVERVAQSA